VDLLTLMQLWSQCLMRNQEKSLREWNQDKATAGQNNQLTQLMILEEKVASTISKKASSRMINGQEKCGLKT